MRLQCLTRRACTLLAPAALTHAIKPRLQCLTLENYDTVMYPLVAANNWGAAAFMLAWLVVGYFVLLTLFMAIIMEAFESKYNVDATEEAFTACESCKTCHSPTSLTASLAMRCMVPAHQCLLEIGQEAV